VYVVQCMYGVWCSVKTEDGIQVVSGSGNGTATGVPSKFIPPSYDGKTVIQILIDIDPYVLGLCLCCVCFAWLLLLLLLHFVVV